MMLTDEQLAQLLVAEHYATSEDISRARAWAQRSRASLVDYLLEKHILSKDLLGQALAEHFGVPYADLNTYPPARDTLLAIPQETATDMRTILFRDEAKRATVATDNPKNPAIEKTLKTILKGKKITIAYSLPEDIDDLLKQYQARLGGQFLSLIKDGKGAPEVLTEIINDALTFHASDIHLEPQDHEVMVRFRIDGVLHEIGAFSKEFYEQIINRIKVSAHVRTDEHFSAQDGSIRHIHGTATINLRISIIPTLDGEKIVMRILAEYIRGFTLADLGLSEKHQLMLLASAKKPFGMILVVGPTGSGKTTTLYGLLKHLNQPEINITTIEDPVEYKIPGINHIQVNPLTNLTFAKGLRSIVRQDPDIIFLGEIRDQESAEIAVNAALTGHLLLSTFHANDAATAIPRLLDMGIERFLLASTLELVIAQTLTRRLCEQCRFRYREKRSNIKALAKGASLYRAKGCNACAHTGYKGRIALYEFISNTPSLQECILTNPSTKDIWKRARTEGALSMFDDGIEKAKAGLTTLEEVLRVAAPPTEKYYGS